MGRDIGGYFDKMTKQAKGGRRLGTSTPPTTSTTTPSSTSTSAPTSGRGSLKDIIKDAVSKGKSAVQKTGSKINPSPAPSPRPGTPLPDGGVVSIEYTPAIDGDPDPGEVVWNWIPFEEDPTQGKDRPVVVIGRRGSALVGVPLTTKQNDREAQIPMGTGDWDPQRRESFARVWRMLDLDPSGMRREGAVLDRTRFDQLVAAVDRYYDVSYPSASTTSPGGGANRPGNNPNDDY